MNWYAIFYLYLTHLPLNKMAAISQATLQNAISSLQKFCILIRISLKFVPQCPIDNKWPLVQVMACRQITWTTADPVRRCIYAALGGDELNSENFKTSYIYFYLTKGIQGPAWYMGCCFATSNWCYCKCIDVCVFIFLFFFFSF